MDVVLFYEVSTPKTILIKLISTTVNCKFKREFDYARNVHTQNDPKGNWTHFFVMDEERGVHFHDIYSRVSSRGKYKPEHSDFETHGNPGANGCVPTTKREGSKIYVRQIAD